MVRCSQEGRVILNERKMSVQTLPLRDAELFHSIVDKSLFVQRIFFKLLKLFHFLYYYNFGINYLIIEKELNSEIGRHQTISFLLML